MKCSLLNFVKFFGARLATKMPDQRTVVEVFVCINCSMAECFQEKLRWCSTEQAELGVKCKTLSIKDWTCAI